ncbi:unnamed protein product [Choristocarpus tenellus]
MNEDGADRRKRLKALRDRASKGKGDARVEEDSTIKFRNYRPQDSKVKEKIGTNSRKVLSGSANGKACLITWLSHGSQTCAGLPPFVTEDLQVRDEEDEAGERKVTPPKESLIQQELRKQKETVDAEDLNIAPKKANWDLKRDVEKKMEKLNRRTQRAIVELLRERIAEDTDGLCTPLLPLQEMCFSGLPSQRDEVVGYLHGGANSRQEMPRKYVTSTNMFAFFLALTSSSMHMMCSNPFPFLTHLLCQQMLRLSSLHILVVSTS